MVGVQASCARPVRACRPPAFWGTLSRSETHTESAVAVPGGAAGCAWRVHGRQAGVRTGRASGSGFRGHSAAEALPNPISLSLSLSLSPLSLYPRPGSGTGSGGLEPRERNTHHRHASTRSRTPLLSNQLPSKTSSPAPPTPHSSALVCAHLGPLSEFPVGALGSLGWQGALSGPGRPGIYQLGPPWCPGCTARFEGISLFAAKLAKLSKLFA